MLTLSDMCFITSRSKILVHHFFLSTIFPFRASRPEIRSPLQMLIFFPCLQRTYTGPFPVSGIKQDSVGLEFSFIRPLPEVDRHGELCRLQRKTCTAKQPPTDSFSFMGGGQRDGFII